MFWHDISGILEVLSSMKAHLLDIELKVDSVIQRESADKTSTMMNEFKGCVSMARAAIAERKESEKVEKQKWDKVCDKLDAILKALSAKKEKKPRKTTKSSKKTPNSDSKP